MPRKRKPQVDSRGPIRVRATYSGPWSGAFRLGYGFWHISWFPADSSRDERIVPLNLGVSCVQPLDVWVPVPDGSVGYCLFPVPDGDTPDTMRPIPPLDDPDSKKPRLAPITRPLDE